MTAHLNRGHRMHRTVALTALLLVVWSMLGPVPAVAAERGDIEFSELKWPFPDTDRSFVGAIDVAKRRMYAFGKEGMFDPFYNVAEYDISSRVPRLLRVGEPGVTQAGLFSPYRVILDNRRGRMLIIETRSSGGRSLIEVVDLKTLERSAVWDVTRTVPGFLTTGFTYDEKADLLYLVGDFTASVNGRALYALTGTKPIGQGSAVVALSAETGAFVWASLMPQCDTPLDSATTGALIARSARRDALYTFCMGGPLGHQPSGQNGLVRMDISDQDGVTGVTQFPTEFFPISGTYSEFNNTGVAAFDPASERFFAQSLASRTPGTWVFDGLRDTWVGFVAAPDNMNLYGGLNPANGRYYMGGDGGHSEPGYVNVTDGRATPVPQGTLVEDIPLRGMIVADPVTGRLFAPSSVKHGMTEDNLPKMVNGLVMLHDNTQSIAPLPPLELDRLTKDLPDKQALLQYSGGTSGFGARYTAIGGWESVYDRTTVPFINNIVKPAVGNNPADLAYGDRGFTFAAVPSVDIRPAGASATAAASAVDQATESDRTDVESEAGVAPEAPVELFGDSVTCLDGGGQPVKSPKGSGDPGRAYVECDLEKSLATGAASFADDAGERGQSLVAAAFDTRTFRDAKRGAVTETTATVKGVSLHDPGGRGEISIDRVSARATTVANGRPGTSLAQWESLVEGIVVTDGDGAAQQPMSCSTTVVAGKPPERRGECAEILRAVSSLSPRLQIRLPVPTVTATPRGAYARVEEREADYLSGLTTSNDQSRAVPAMEVTLYNDGPEKGRLLVQYAAIDANSIFTRTALPTFPDFSLPDAGATVDTGTATSLADGATSDSNGQTALSSDSGDMSADAGDGLAAAPADIQPAVAVGDEGLVAALPEPARSIVGWLIGRRSARDAAMSGGVWLLFSGALYGVWRRRRLIETVGG